MLYRPMVVPPHQSQAASSPCIWRFSIFAGWERFGDSAFGSCRICFYGLYNGTAVLDLDYDEDSSAQADANFVLTASGGIVEVQGTAEEEPFSQDEFDQLMALARAGLPIWLPIEGDTR